MYLSTYLSIYYYSIIITSYLIVYNDIIYLKGTAIRSNGQPVIFFTYSTGNFEKNMKKPQLNRSWIHVTAAEQPFKRIDRILTIFGWHSMLKWMEKIIFPIQRS